jgi:hypothetical protein
MRRLPDVSCTSRLSTLGRIGLALLVAGTVALAPLTLWGKDQVPFHASFNTHFDSTVVLPIAYVEVTGCGIATHLGLTTVGSINEEVNLLTGVGTATFHIKAANGDELVMEFVMSFVPTETGFTFTGDWSVSSGTGRFVQATGTGTLEGWANFTGPTDGVGFFAMDGTILSGGKRK